MSLRFSAKLRRELSNFVRDAMVNRMGFTSLVPDGIRSSLLRGLGFRVGRSRVSYGGYFGGRSISVGDSCFIARHVYIDASALVQIGNNVQIGPFVKLLTSTHEIGSADRRAGEPRSSRIVIEDGVWIGAGAIVLPGVTIRAGSVIGAGALVIADCEENTMYAGVPAREIRKI